MIAHPSSRTTLEKQPAFWARFGAGSSAAAIRPQGQLTFSVSANPAVQEELLQYLQTLQAA
jgi:hypothetical protein